MMIQSYLYYFLLFVTKEPEYGSFNIVGGDPVTIEEVPFMAIYKSKVNQYGCGASIINERFVVTAAHCSNPKVENTEVVVGTDKINEGEHYDIESSYPHPNYEDLDYDVIVLKLAKDLVFSSKVQPIKLAEPNMDIEEGAEFEAIGFGMTDPRDKNSKSPVLRRVKLPYVNNEMCNKEFYGIITDRMICAGEYMKSACYGDSGGPVVYKNTLVGIVSFGGRCGHDRPFYSVNARVAALRDHIDGVLNK